MLGKAAQKWAQRVSDAFARFGLEEPDETPDGTPVGYKSVELSVPACAYLLENLDKLPGLGKSGDLRKEIERAVEIGRYYELPLASDTPWHEVEMAAIEQGVDEACIVYDKAGRHYEPPAPRKRNR